MKTVGILSLMAQSGLHVPVQSGHFCMHNLVLCDIGDGQSIDHNLSTFSAHMTNIIDILKQANHESLVLLDELGSGTDPAEGMGIAIAILEELRLKNCLFIATTHYPEVKEYAAYSSGLINARMAFDRESLKPLYQLEIGEAGESCALYIAKRLGFPAHMLERAHQEAYNKKMCETSELALDKWSDSKKGNDLAGPTVPIIKREIQLKKSGRQITQYQIGDSVTVGPENKIGLVFQPADKKGMVGVQVHGKKLLINQKRLALKTSASELYPPDYDFSIIFDTVENRKARHQMNKKYTPGLSISTDPSEKNTYR
jgi:dsDNA-specific endonuclease/ATPase MutS2